MTKPNKSLANVTLQILSISVLLLGCSSKDGGSKGVVVHSTTPLPGIPAKHDNWSVDDIGKPGVPRPSLESLKEIQRAKALVAACRRKHLRWSFGGGDPTAQYGVIVYDSTESADEQPKYVNEFFFCVINHPGYSFNPTTDEEMLFPNGCRRAGCNAHTHPPMS